MTRHRIDIDSADALAKQQTLDPVDVGGSLAHQTLPLPIALRRMTKTTGPMIAMDLKATWEMMVYGRSRFAARWRQTLADRC